MHGGTVYDPEHNIIVGAAVLFSARAKELVSDILRNLSWWYKGSDLED